MEPMWHEPMACPQGLDPALAQAQSSAENLPPGVPKLASRWNSSGSINGDKKNHQTFGEFSEITLKAYY
jgi:hypothetical protein